MQTIKQSILSIVIGLALVAGLSYAWTGPTATPPNSNASAPINVSASSQIKGGTLQVNGFRNIGSSIFDGLAEFKSNVEVGIGAVLTVNGRLRILDGTQKEGRVLTSDDNGYSTWRQPTPPPTVDIGFGARFGGMYFKKSPNCLQVNPFTGGCSCPSGYTSIEASYTIPGDNNNISINWCYK